MAKPVSPATMLARTAEAKSPVPIKVIMKVKMNKANPAK